MGAKAVCPRHEVAHPRDQACPYCETPEEDEDTDPVRVIPHVYVGYDDEGPQQRVTGRD